jgi:hypothetical protein
MLPKRGTAQQLDHYSYTLLNRAPTAVDHPEPIQHRLGNQKLLASAHIILRLRLDQSVRCEELELTALNLVGRAICQAVSYISQHRRL